MYGYWGVISLVLIGVCLGACRAMPRQPALEERGPAVMDVVAEWEDVERAIEVAVRRVEMAIVDKTIGATEKSFELRTVREQPARLVARRAVDTPLPRGASVPIRLEVFVGPFGDPEAERALLRATVERLRQLHGREWAPVR